mmetsp:Transcript_6118/g.14747  ORF Transcript_6118/g.14747 Transcript_6118/m.14747 type:complete len:207 (+) Transcript_6118:777-1397(+)
MLAISLVLACFSEAVVPSTSETNMLVRMSTFLLSRCAWAYDARVSSNIPRIRGMPSTSVIFTRSAMSGKDFEMSFLTRSLSSPHSSVPVGPPPTTTKWRSRSISASLAVPALLLPFPCVDCSALALSMRESTFERTAMPCSSSFRKWACSFTPLMPNVAGWAPTLITSLSYGTSTTSSPAPPWRAEAMRQRTVLPLKSTSEQAPWM